LHFYKPAKIVRDGEEEGGVGMYEEGSVNRKNSRIPDIGRIFCSKFKCLLKYDVNKETRFEEIIVWDNL
jgi:hypothetical protein